MAGFQDKAVRQGFTRKVLGIVAVQLIITMLFSVAFYYSAPLKVFQELLNGSKHPGPIALDPSLKWWYLSW